MNKLGAIWLAIILVILSTGCSSISKAEQPVVIESHLLDHTLSLGQTFSARYEGMDGIEIYLEPRENGDGYLQLSLRESPQNLENLAVASLPIAEISAPGFYQFQIPVQVNSNQQDYYLLLKVKGNGNVMVGTAPGHAYVKGALYQGNHPKDHLQMAFKLSYYAPRLGLGLIREGFTWGWYLIVAVFLFVLPGWAILDLLIPDVFGAIYITQSTPSTKDIRRRQNFWVKLCVAVGLSLAIYPILFLWTDLFGLHLGLLYAWVPGVLASIILLWQRRKILKLSGRKNLLHALQHSLFGPWNVTLIMVLALVVLTRFWVIRSLEIPMWGDSYQHTMMAQLLADNGGLFDSWQPYAELSTFTYHFGFHSLATLFHWMTSLPMPLAVLWIGQILNVMAIFLLYPLAQKISKNQWSGIIAIFIAGLLTSMPMFYVNWGRYTQLAGLSIMLICTYLTWEFLDRSPLDKRFLFVCWLIWAGLALTHYRVLVFTIVFLPAFLVFTKHKESLKSSILKIIWLGLGAGLISLPWYINVLLGKLSIILTAHISTPPQQLSSFEQQYNQFGNLTGYLPLTIWILMAICTIWGFWKKIPGIRIVAGWWFFVVLAANPQWLRLPGSGILTNFAVFIAMYVPAALLISVPAGKLIEKLLHRFSMTFPSMQRLPAFVIGISIVIIGMVGARQRLYDVIVPVHALAVRPDLRASTWIQENLPADAHFLVNSFPAYGNSSVVGSDGGWWLPIIANRTTTLPPLTYTSEQGPRPDYQEWINTLTKEIMTKGISDPDVLAMLTERGVTHVYIGQQQGQVNYNGPKLEPGQLTEDPHFQPIYHTDRVWIFEFLGQNE